MVWDCLLTLHRIAVDIARADEQDNSILRQIKRTFNYKYATVIIKLCSPLVRQ